MDRETRTACRRWSALGALILAGALVGGAASGCDSGGPGGLCVCTEQFVIHTVRVVDAAGAPVTGLDVTVVRVSDGLAFDVSGGDPLGTPGVYLLMDDRFTSVLGTAGEAVRFEGRKDGRLVTADFVFRTDPCRCHVEKVRGPDQIVF